MRLYSWDGKALSEKATLEGNKGTVSALAFSPDGKLLAFGSSECTVGLLDGVTLGVRVFSLLLSP